MFTLKLPSKKTTGLEDARDEALSVLNSFDPVENEEQYATALAVVETLSNLIAQESKEKLSPNTIATIVGNFAIGVLIVGYEQHNVVTTKAQNFLLKLK